MSQINIKVSPDELKKIDENAKKANLSRSSFIRLVSINSQVKITNANSEPACH